MKLRYYLRGLGIGIAVTALFFVIYTGRVNHGMSDEEVKKRAAELGMIENTVLKPVAGDSDHTAVEEPSTTDEPDTDAPVTEEPKTDAPETDGPVTEEPDTQEPDTDGSDTDGPDTEDSTAQEPVTGDDRPAEEYVQITINRGDSSLTAARKLEEAGVIEDAKDFDRYLSQNGYDKYIKTGVHEIPLTGTYEQIARKLTSR